jgi:deoxyribodipyrimidine photo-lyase
VPSVLWLRRDLRRRDHPAWRAAGTGEVHALFVVDPRLWRGAGPVRRGWLAASVRALREDLDGRLTVRLGDPVEVVPRFAAEVGAGSVHVSGETTPYGGRRDRAVERALGEVPLVRTGTPYAVDPGTLRTGAGGPYRVYGAFARAWREHGWPAPVADSAAPLAAAETDGRVEALLDDAVRDAGVPLPAAGERAARARWRDFLGRVADGATDYATERDRPDLDGTTQLSPYLKVGALHPRTLLADLARVGSGENDAADALVGELGWREFYADVLHHRPDSAWRDLREDLARLRYDDPADAIEAWRRGETGYPVVDAGMRQLAATGWMHNRVRMITASFLTKDLHVWWPVGARHFLDALLDGDLASNSHNWQWVAGTGTDPAPYFRVFNPVTQGRRFDPRGDYVRRWVPELRHLDGAAVHEPWRAPDGYDAGYPRRLVDHDAERREALARYEAR